MTTIPLAEARAQLSRIVDEVVRTHQRVDITRNGVRAAVLLGAADFDALVETLDVLADADPVREIGIALAEETRGEIASTQDVLAGMRAAGRHTPSHRA